MEEKIAMHDQLELCAYWHNQPLTAESYISKIKEFLLRLKSIDDDFNLLYVLGESETNAIKIDSNYSNFETEVVSHLSRPDEYISYVNQEGEKVEFSLSVNTRIGFNCTFTTSISDSQKGFFISTSIGSCEDVVNSIIISSYGENDDDSRMLNLFKETISFWRPYNAYINTREIDLKAGQPIAEVRIGIVTYFSNLNVRNNIFENYFLEKANGGVIVKISENIKKENVEKNTNKIIRLRNLLKPTGFLER